MTKNKRDTFNCRKLTDSELLQVSGGQDVPISNLTIEMDADTCRNITNGEIRQEVCIKAIQAQWQFVQDILPTLQKTFGVICIMCLTRIAFLVDRAEARGIRIRLGGPG